MHAMQYNYVCFKILSCSRKCGKKTRESYPNPCVRALGSITKTNRTEFSFSITFLGVYLEDIYPLYFVVQVFVQELVLFIVKISCIRTFGVLIYMLQAIFQNLLAEYLHTYTYVAYSVSKTRRIYMY